MSASSVVAFLIGTLRLSQENLGRYARYTAANELQKTRSSKRFKTKRRLFADKRIAGVPHPHRDSSRGNRWPSRY